MILNTSRQSLVTQSDTIAAIATSPGVASIAVVRVSGADAIELVDNIFTGKRDLTSEQSHTVHVGIIKDAAGQPVDQVVCTIFKSPHSYTGEDVVEISCHGGTFVSRKILEFNQLLKIRKKKLGNRNIK